MTKETIRKELEKTRADTLKNPKNQVKNDKYISQLLRSYKNTYGEDYKE